MVQLEVHAQGEEALPIVIPSVGDAVGGGIVFKVIGSKVYVSAEADLGQFQWGCNGTSISGADGTAIGTGKQNTLDIVSGCSDTDSAAYMCDDATIEGFTDWYLPSIDELEEMYDNKAIIGGFANNNYWSSSEVSSGDAWRTNFYSGYISTFGKEYASLKVRPIRSYTIATTYYRPSVYLDLGDVSIKANYSSVEIQDISKRKSEYTNAFTLPFSTINNDFFAHFYEVNISEGSFRADLKTKCTIYVDSTTQFEGYLQLLSVDKINETYNVLSFGDIANISKELGEGKLNELDLSKYNHLLTQSNVEESWNGNINYEGTEPNGKQILYPIIDYGRAYTGDSISTDEGAIRVRDLRPAISVKSLFDAIIEKAGYTYVSTFLNSTFFVSQYMTLANEVEGAVTNSVDGFKVGMTTDQTVSNTATGVPIIEFDNETGASGFFDVNGNFDTSTYKYTVPHSGSYKIRVQLVVDDNVGIPNDIPIYYSINGVVAGSQTFGDLSILGTGLTDVYTLESDLAEFELNDEIGIHITPPDIGGLDIKTAHSFSGTSYDSFVQLIEAPASVEGGEVDFSAGNSLLPKEKQVDFIKSILARYNLIVEVDAENVNKLNIEPLQDYYDAGSSKDWTDKIDASKSIVISPTTSIRNKSINLKDLEDTDTLNSYWQDHESNIYNQKQFDFFGDFGNGELTIPSIFSSFAPKKMLNNEMYLSKHFEWADGEAKLVKTKPKLFYYSGKKQLPPSSYYKLLSETTGVYTNKVEYPFAHHYSMNGTQVQETDVDIRFDSRDTFSFSSLVATQTGSDVYEVYWKRYLANIYDKDSRIMNAYFHLTAEDIADFRYNDKVFIQDSYWRVNKISSYAMGVDNSTKVELIKILESVNDSTCSLTIESYNLTGTTSWLDAAGGSVTPTQECCEAEGLTYLGTTCWWNFATITDAPDQPPITTDPDTGDIEVGVIEGQGIIVGSGTSEVSLMGDIKQIGKPASDGEVLTWSASNDATRWLAPTPSGVITDRIDISISEYQNLHTTPITLLDTPGTDNTLIPTNIFIYAKHSGTETSTNNLYIGFSSSVSSGDYYAYIRNFMKNEVGNRVYVASPSSGEISQGSTENRRLSIYSGGAFTGQIDLIVFVSYQIKDMS